MQVRIGADVNNAVAGINKVNQSLNTLPTSAGKANVALSKLPQTSNQATLALSNLSRVAQDAPYGFIGIANNLNPLLESFQRLKASTGSTKGALKALGSSLTGAGGIGLALGIVSSLAVVFGDKLFGAGKAAEKAKTAADALRDSINGIFKEIAKEATEVGSLVTVLKNETETRERRLAAIKELQKIQPDIFAGLKLEGSAVIGLDNAYKNYLGNLKNVIAAKIIQAQIEQKIEQLLRLQGVAASKAEKDLLAGVKNFQASLQNKTDLSGVKLFPDMGGPQKRQLQTIEQDIKNLFDELGNYSKSIELKPANLNLSPDRVTVAKPRDLSFANDFDFEAALFSKIKIPKLKVGFQLESPGSAAGNADSTDNLFEREVQKMNALGNIVTNFVTPAFQTFFDTIAQGGNAFKAFGQAVIQSLTGLITKLITTVALAAILSAVTGGAAGVGFQGASGFKQIFSSLLGFRAAGGPVGSGQPYVVGEQGRELFVPSTSGRIIPNNQLNGLSGSASPSIIFNGRLAVSGNELKLLLNRTDRYQGVNV